MNLFHKMGYGQARSLYREIRREGGSYKDSDIREGHRNIFTVSKNSFGLLLCKNKFPVSLYQTEIKMFLYSYLS